MVPEIKPTSNFDELPRCHYCGRYAFEMNFQGIHVCDKCIDKMTAGRVWRVLRDTEGHVWVSVTDSIEGLEIVGEGSFIEMWELAHKDDPNYG